MAETFTKFPNWLFERMSEFSTAEWMILSLIVRETRGFHRREAIIDYKQFEPIIANRSRLNDIIESLIERGFVARQRNGRTFSYSLPSPELLRNVTDESEPESDDVLHFVTDSAPDLLQNVTSQDAELLQNVTGTCYEMSQLNVTDRNSLHYKKEKKESLLKSAPNEKTPITAVDELQDHFYRETNFLPDPRRPKYQQQWIEPLERILALTGGNVEEAKTLITAAVKKAWATIDKKGEPFVVHTPYSIVTFATNIANHNRAAESATDEDTIWQRAMAHISSKTAPTEPRLFAAMQAVTWEALANANEYTQQRLKPRLANAYRSATV